MGSLLPLPAHPTRTTTRTAALLPPSSLLPPGAPSPSPPPRPQPLPPGAILPRRHPLLLLPPSGELRRRRAPLRRLTGETSRRLRRTALLRPRGPRRLLLRLLRRVEMAGELLLRSRPSPSARRSLLDPRCRGLKSPSKLGSVWCRTCSRGRAAGGRGATKAADDFALLAGPRPLPNLLLLLPPLSSPLPLPPPSSPPLRLSPLPPSSPSPLSPRHSKRKLLAPPSLSPLPSPPPPPPAHPGTKPPLPVLWTRGAPSPLLSVSARDGPTRSSRLTSPRRRTISRSPQKSRRTFPRTTSTLLAPSPSRRPSTRPPRLPLLPPRSSRTPRRRSSSAPVPQD